MKINSNITQDREIMYLRFLNETLQIKVLKEEICDLFTGNIFDYLQGNPSFDPQVFCAFLYKFIYKCRLITPLVESAKENPIERLKLKRKFEELFFFLDGSQIGFALSSFDSNSFSTPLEEKLKHLLATESISRKTPHVKIVLPEFHGNTDIIPYVDLEFVIPRLTVEQKLDVLHFAICAFNFLSQKDESMKIISENINSIRDSIMLNSVRDMENLDDESNFDNSSPEITRILKVSKRDSNTEKLWADENSRLFSKKSPDFIKEFRLTQLRQPFDYAENNGLLPISRAMREENNNLNEESNKSDRCFSLRQKVFALMLLTFQRLDVPEDITKERVVEFFYGITGGSRKNLRDLLANPTANKDTSKSIKLLCDDLNFVRDYLGKLGLSENVLAAINEINFLIEDLRDKENEP